MSFTPEQQSLFDHMRNSVPRWLTRGVSAALEWLYAFTDIFDAVRAQGQTWLDLTYILQATGSYLDQHAKDRNITRRFNEPDASLQQRIRYVSDVVTEPALVAAINAMLSANHLANCGFVNLRRDGGHYQTTGSSTAFMSRGYRLERIKRPMEYIVILPFGTTSAISGAVADYLRLFGPAGYEYTIEVRQSP